MPYAKLQDGLNNLSTVCIIVMLAIALVFLLGFLIVTFWKVALPLLAFLALAVLVLTAAIFIRGAAGIPG